MSVRSVIRPIIGITGTRHQIPLKVPGPGLRGVVSADDYAQGVEAAGGIPVVIPYLAEFETVRALATHLDGLLLGGGEDPDPALYGEQPEVGLGTVIPERDGLELTLVAAMVAANKPILGICRGIQLLNVAFGGSLYQDLPRHWRGLIQHMQRAARSHLSHTVHVDPKSRLYHLLGERRQVRTNSFHHQAVRELGMDLRAVAWDDEGLVEAIEHPDYAFLVGVQWHPENLWREHPEFHGLFQGLVDAASQASLQAGRWS
jgi:putative glutamine amidotransferase